MLPRKLLDLRELGVLKENQAFNLLCFISRIYAYRLTLWRPVGSDQLHLWDPMGNSIQVSDDITRLIGLNTFLSGMFNKRRLCLEMSSTFIPLNPNTFREALSLNKGKMSCFVHLRSGFQVYCAFLLTEEGKIRVEGGKTEEYNTVSDLSLSKTTIGNALKGGNLLLCTGESYPPAWEINRYFLKPQLPGVKI